MKIIICGAGLVGQNIASYLANEGNSVTVIDQDREVIRSLSEKTDLRAITGFASHPEVLKAAGADDADLIIAATQSDEVNMVVCQVAHSIFHINEKIARLRTESYTNAIYADLYQRDHMPVDVVISPEKSVSQAIASLVENPAANDYYRFFQDKLVFLGLKIDAQCPVLSTPLNQLSDLFSTFRGQVVGIGRNDQLQTPKKTDQIFENDQIYLVVHKDDEARAYEIFGKSVPETRNILIVGGGEVAEWLTEYLEETGQYRVKIIEKSLKRAEALSDIVNSSLIFHGDGLDPVLLTEANVAQADSVVFVTDDDKTNLLGAARAKSMGSPHVLALVNEPSLEDLAMPLGIDSTVNPRAITVSSILRHIRSGSVSTVHIVGNNEAEVMEVQVLGSSALSGRKIGDIEWPEGVIVGAVYDREKLIIANHDTKLNEGNKIVLFALRKSLSQVEKMLRVSIDYF